MTTTAKKSDSLDKRYQSVYDDVSGVVDVARGHAARSINSIMTAAYWLIGQYIVEFEQEGRERANYGEEIIIRLSVDLSARFGRGFSVRNLRLMRSFFLSHQKRQTVSAESGSRQKWPTASAGSWDHQKWQTVSAESSLNHLAPHFPLPWSAYVRLLSVKSSHAREFYEMEALRGGWTVRQLDRQINSQFYERTSLSKDKAAMLNKGKSVQYNDTPLPEEEIKDPYILEFLNLKDEYSESDLEEALVNHLETFLLELGNDFCFMGRQRRLRVGDEWYRMDLVFYHRRLRCMIIIDLKLGKFTHADAGQMHLYLNYALKNWIQDGENPPVGLILCAQKNEAVARYALEGLPNKVMAAEYRTALPDEELLASEIDRARKAIDASNLLQEDKLSPEDVNRELGGSSGGIS